MDVEVRRTLARLDVDAVADPLTELSNLASQVAAWKDALGAKVNDLTALRYTATGAGTERLRAEVVLWERAPDRCAAVLGMIVKLGLDERMVVIQQAQADVVIRAVNAAIAAAGITAPADRQAARTAAARGLRSVQ